jgi:trans-aconitate methyltransferase
MSLDQQTIVTYDQAAKAMADHFQNYSDGVIKEEIELALHLAGDPKQPRIVEIGCGAGKDAAALVKLAGWYEGFDPSVGLLDIARSTVPGANFVQADALSYDYPENLDIVFAFASMLHLGKKDFANTCHKIAAALKPGGVACMVLKEADSYTEQLQEDEFGKRLFYLYTPSLVRELAGEAFEQVYENHELVGPQQKRWFTIVLRKI